MNHDLSSYFAAARSAKSHFPSKIGFLTPPPPVLRQRIQSDCDRSNAPGATERTQSVPLLSTPVAASTTKSTPRNAVILPSAPQLQSLKLNPLLHSCLKLGSHGLRGFQELLSSHAHFDPSAPENLEVVDFNQNFEADERRGNFRYRIGHVGRAPVFLPAPKGFKRKSEVSESNKGTSVTLTRHLPSSPSIVSKLDSKFAKESAPKKVHRVTPAALVLDDVHCGICGDDEAEADDLIVLCDGPCGNAFHQQCFGIAQIPTGNWFCSSACARAGRLVVDSLQSKSKINQTIAKSKTSDDTGSRLLFQAEQESQRSIQFWSKIEETFFSDDVLAPHLVWCDTESDCPSRVAGSDPASLCPFVTPADSADECSGVCQCNSASRSDNDSSNQSVNVSFEVPLDMQSAASFADLMNLPTFHVLSHRRMPVHRENNSNSQPLHSARGEHILSPFNQIVMSDQCPIADASFCLRTLSQACCVELGIHDNSSDSKSTSGNAFFFPPQVYDTSVADFLPIDQLSESFGFLDMHRTRTLPGFPASTQDVSLELPTFHSSSEDEISSELWLLQRELRTQMTVNRYRKLALSRRIRSRLAGSVARGRALSELSTFESKYQQARIKWLRQKMTHVSSGNKSKKVT